MKKLNLLRLLFGTMLVFAATAFTSCVDDNDDTEAPFLEVSPTTVAFDTNGQAVDGDSFVIKSNRHWTATLDNEAAAWITLSKYEGNGTSTVSVSVPAGNPLSGTVEVAISNQLGVLKMIPVTITRGEVQPEEVIFSETCGTEDVASKPFVSDYKGWKTTGSGSAEVTFSGTNTSVRSSGLANKGSGPNVIFFGNAPASVTVNKITLTAEQTNLKLTFLGSYSYKPDGAPDYDNTFDPSKFIVALSADGTSWTDITYTKNDGDTTTPYWVTATANFTLAKAVENLYIRFTATASSAFRLDDIKLVTGNGGQTVDLEGGVTPPEPTDAIYHENFGTAAPSKSPFPLVPDYTDWEKGGTAGSSVTYSNSGNVSLRASGKLSAGYPDASGSSKLFFGTNSPEFIVKEIPLTSTQTKLSLNFGGSYSKRNADNTYDNVFHTDKFHLYLSADGTTWSSEITYTQAQADEYWVYVTSDFTLSKAVSKLYIKFVADEESVYAIDDLNLAEGKGGQTVDLEGGVTPPEPTGALYHENFGTAAPSKSPFPLVPDYTDWEKGGTVGSSVTYSNSGNVSLRASGKLSAGYPDASGSSKLFFGTNSPEFIVKEIPLTSTQTKLSLNFGGSYSKKNADNTYDNVFHTDKFHLYLSADGTTWSSEITYTQAKADEYWVYVTSDFTLSKAVSKLYIKFVADEESVFAIDDLNLAEGKGGQTVDLEGGSSQDPSLAVSPTSLSFTADADNTGKEISCTISNQGALQLFAKSSDNTQFPTTVAGSKVVVKALANATDQPKNATITVYLAESESGTQVSPKTVAVTQAAQGGGSGGSIVVDFTLGVDVSTPALPINTAAITSTTPTSYTIGGLVYKIASSATGKFMWNEYNGGSLYFSKGGAFIEFPSIADKTLTKVIYTAPAGMGKDVMIKITDTAGNTISGGEDVAVTASETVTFNLSGTAVNTAYRVVVATEKNAQVAKLELIYAETGGGSTPNITGVNPSSLSWMAESTAEKTVSIQGTNFNGFTLSALTNFNASVNGTTVTVSPKAINAGTTDINETLTITATGGNSATVSLTQSASQGGNVGTWSSQNFSGATETKAYNTALEEIVDGWQGIFVRVGAASTAYDGKFGGTPISFQTKNKESYIISPQLSDGIQALKFESMKTNKCETPAIDVSIEVGGVEIWKGSVAVETTFRTQEDNLIDFKTETSGFTAGHSIADLQNASFTIKLAPQSNTGANSVALGNVSWLSNK